MKIKHFLKARLLSGIAAILFLAFGTHAQMTVPPHVTTPMMTVGKLQDLCNARTRIETAKSVGNIHSISNEDWIDDATCAGYLEGVLDSCDERTAVTPNSDVYINCAPAD